MAQYEREDDHDGAAADRLPRRLRMPNLQALLAVFVERWQRIENVAWQLYTERTIDDAVGAQLEQLGKKAGYWPRNFVSADGSEDDDEVYRARVKAKFIANRSNGLEPEIGAVFDALALPGITYEYEPGYPATFTWRAVEMITPVQARICLRFLAWSKPAGVRALFAWQETSDADAFSTATGAGIGFGDIGAPGGGGALVGIREAI